MHKQTFRELRGHTHIHTLFDIECQKRFLRTLSKVILFND